MKVNKLMCLDEESVHPRKSIENNVDMAAFALWDPEMSKVVCWGPQHL